MGAVEVTKASSPSQAWGRKMGGWSDSWGLAGEAGATLSAEKSVALQRPSCYWEKLTD